MPVRPPSEPSLAEHTWHYQSASCIMYWHTLATLVEYIMIIIQRLMDPFPYLGLSQSFGTITAEPSRASSTQSYLVSLVLNRTSCIIAQELSKWHINYPLMGSRRLSHGLHVSI